MLVQRITLPPRYNHDHLLDLGYLECKIEILEEIIINRMADNKNKIQEDKNLISFKQHYEVDYAVRQLQKQFPEETKTDIKNALFGAARQVRPSEGRGKIMRLARKELNN